MIKIVQTCCFTLILNAVISGQELRGFGVFVGIASAMHTNFDPTMPQDGSTQLNPLRTYTAGVFKKHNLYKKLYLRHSFGYLQTGYSEYRQVHAPSSGSTFTFTNYHLRNRFHNFSYEALLIYHFTDKKRFNFSPILGMEDNILLSKMVESPHQPLLSSFRGQELNHWSIFRLNRKIGFNLDIEDRISFDFTHTRSISPVLRTEKLVARDWIWTTRIVIVIL